MKGWGKKYRRNLLAVILGFMLPGMVACSQGRQEVGQSTTGDTYKEMQGSVESSGGTESSMDNDAPAQYVYSSETLRFTEYGDRVNIRGVAGKDDQVYVLLEVQNWKEEDGSGTDDQPSELFYQVFSCQADGSQGALSDKIIPGSEEGCISDINISNSGCVAALYQPFASKVLKLMYWNPVEDVFWEEELDALEGSLFMKGDDVVVLLADSGRYSLYTYDKNGEAGYLMAMEAGVFEDAQAVYLQADGCFLVVKTNIDGITYAQMYDPISGRKERKNLPDHFERYQVFQGTADDVLLCDTVGVYRYAVGEEVLMPFFTYVDGDLDIERFQWVCQIDETHFVGSYYEGMDNILELFSRAEAPEDIKVIVLGVFHEYDVPKDRILDFNRENNGYRITVKNYASYSDEMDALALLNIDILAGNMPDILAVDSGLPLKNYIAKGLLADVGELISCDEELSKVEFMDNVLDALHVDGTLYHIASAFTVDTLIAKRSIVGDRTGWDPDEFLDILETLPEGMEVMSEMSRQEYLASFMDACADEIVDYESGVCHFDAQVFKAALEFAATLPKEAESYGEGEYTVDPKGYMFDSRYIENKVLLQPVTISRIMALCPTINGALGEDGAYVGFPCESGEGGVMRLYGTSFVLSGKSSNLEGAWEFARYLLTEEYQSGLLYGRGGLPTRRDVFEKNIQDAAGYEGFCFINNEFINLPALTQEQLDRAVAFIEGVHHFAFDDEVIMSIIYEEAESYFLGQKGVEDVAGVIQNRVRMYLQEQ